MGPAGPRQLLVPLRRNHQDAEHLSDAPVVQHTNWNFDGWHRYISKIVKTHGCLNIIISQIYSVYTLFATTDC